MHYLAHIGRRLRMSPWNVHISGVLSSNGFERWNTASRYSTSSTTPLDISILYERRAPKPDPRTLNQQLVHLVQERRYGAADRVRLQMVHSAVPIEKHPAFEAPALHALQAQLPPNPLDEFTAWLSLAPDAHHPLATPASQYPFRRIYTWMFRTGVPARRFRYVTRFGLIAAGKGYHRNFLPEIARLVVKFGNAHKIRRYFIQAERMALQYALCHCPEDAQRVAERYRRVAVEMCAMEGRFGEAVDLLQQERSYAVSDATYALLLQAMDNVGKDCRELVAAVERLRSEDGRRRLLQF